MKWIGRISAFINKWKKDRRVRIGMTLAAVIISALIQTYALQVFVRPAGIISGGFTGMAMLVERLGGLWGLNIPMQVTMVALNIPVQGNQHKIHCIFPGTGVFKQYFPPGI